MNYSLIMDHLKAANILVIKRLEILAYLKPLNNKTYNLVKDNMQEFQRMSDKAKKLRILVKGTYRGRNPIVMSKTDKKNALDLLDEFHKNCFLILNDIQEVRTQMAVAIQQVKEELERRNLQDLILLDAQPIFITIKELDAIVKTHAEVRKMLDEMIEVTDKKPKAKESKRPEGVKPPIVGNLRKKLRESK